MSIKKRSVCEEKLTLFAVITGVFAGIVNGVFGGGGGMVVVPMLTSLLKCAPKKAHATALFIILPLSLTSAVFYAAFGSLNLRMAIPVTIGVVAGGVSGAFLLSKLSSRWIVLIFSVVMAIAGIKMLFF
jgi:uncharacterized membrane protein YfcA